jgi:hypothetical protein
MGVLIAVTFKLVGIKASLVMEVVIHPFDMFFLFAWHHKWLMELVVCPLPIEIWVLLGSLAVREFSRRSLQA